MFSFSSLSQGTKLRLGFLGVAALLGFWLSGTLILDGLVVPTLYHNGMMAQSGFAAAGYSLFEMFNHLEILFGAVVLVALLGLGYSVAAQAKNTSLENASRGIVWAITLLAIALLYAYWLTPELGGWGLALENGLGDSASADLSVRAGMPQEMLTLQVIYWVLEVVKLVGGLWLINWCIDTGITRLDQQNSQ